MCEQLRLLSLMRLRHERYVILIISLVLKANRCEGDLSAFYNKRRSTSTGGVSRTWHFQCCFIVKLACGCIGGMCLESSEVIWAYVSRRFVADGRYIVVF